MIDGLLCMPASLMYIASSIFQGSHFCTAVCLQEEVAGKRAKLQRLSAAVALAQQERASLAAQYQSERERLLVEIRRLGAQMKQKAGCPGHAAAGRPGLQLVPLHPPPWRP